jgi:hypothetical protein
MAQELSREQNGVGLSGANNGVGLLRRGDQANAAGRYSGFSPDALGEMSLISRTDWNHGVRNQTS